ncbi:hypothetical protein ACET3X_007657 [Alternaria dauci]|uniref:Uncharacterized protein n=1 Tax=Alternaria dauci TaxID=48095 RepID=A0ABR3UCK4_9PLEO
MTEFSIHVEFNSRYNVFDASGKLPFGVVYGLCRLQKSDTDSRPVLVETAGSVFDVPYALTHGLLTLYEEHPGEATKWIKVDTSSMGEVDASKSCCISVPSPIHRTKNWRDDLTVYLCAIDLQGVLALVLKPGKRYRIRLASRDLGVKKWAYSDRGKFSDSDGGDEKAKLVSSYSHGHATFKVVDDLTFPPRLETRMRLVKSTSLEVTVVNTGSETVTVQPRGHQNFLVPWGPSAPEPDTLDDRPRIIDQSKQQYPPISSLFVVNAATGEIVRGHHDTSICHLKDPKADLRPKIDELSILEPQIPVINVVDLSSKIEGLEDGRYKIRMHPKGCRWWRDVLKKEGGEGEKVPARLWKGWTVPIMLDSDDELDITIKDGKVDEGS